VEYLPLPWHHFSGHRQIGWRTSRRGRVTAMNKLSLDAVAHEQRKKAVSASSGRSAETV
jgi:hypothetical protein